MPLVVCLVRRCAALDPWQPPAQHFLRPGFFPDYCWIQDHYRLDRGQQGPGQVPAQQPAKLRHTMVMRPMVIPPMAMRHMAMQLVTTAPERLAIERGMPGRGVRLLTARTNWLQPIAPMSQGRPAFPLRAVARFRQPVSERCWISPVRWQLSQLMFRARAARDPAQQSMGLGKRSQQGATPKSPHAKAGPFASDGHCPRTNASRCPRSVRAVGPREQYTRGFPSNFRS